MKILPPRTRPSASLVDRLHTPSTTSGRFGYQKYRACLRWEFGFTCAFCLLHESDLAEHGAQALALTGVEHFDPVSAQGAVNSYENCFYTCRLCNGSRRRAPVADRSGRRLLNPCRDVWMDHFVTTPDDYLLPLPGDSDADYTHISYDLNDPRKVTIRKTRRENIEESVRVLEEAPDLLAGILKQIEDEPPMRRTTYLRMARQLRGSIERAVRDLRRYTPIPRDADSACRCGRSDHHRLPVWLVEQLLDIPLPA